ncbi:hypothetical protein [Streptomyces rubiginosohelvolus]|uniref:Uncharacterized protein n=1 Tax=Streptomyces rubiginosohelvolus TaxID=67362 RepID=A0ABW6EVB0_9ACTN
MRDEIMEVIELMWREHGLITHDSAMEKRAPRLATICQGKITVVEKAMV